jgi:hypothetical protein
LRPVPSVAIENDPDMSGQRLALDISREPLAVEIVENAPHKQESRRSTGARPTI